MKNLILNNGSLLILDVICIVNLVLLILGQKYEAIWTLVFVLILNGLYIFFNKKYGTPRKEEY